MAGVDDEGLPVALLEDGTVLERPTVLELAERLGVTSTPASEHYDLVIVGGGPAGPGGRRLRCVGGPAHGDGRARGARRPGRAVQPDRELPRVPRRAQRLGPRAARHRSGAAPRRRAAQRAGRGGARVEGAGRLVALSGGGSLSANCVLVASGVSYRQLDAPGFERFTGAGIYYGAALTEAKSCAEQTVAVIGGANSAGQAAVYFSKYAGRVIMLVRADSLAKSMSHYLIEQIAALDERGGAHRRGSRSRPRATTGACAPCGCAARTAARPSRRSTRPSSSSARRRARTGWTGVVARDDRGFILAGADVKAAGWPLQRDPYPLETSVPGVFVAGDVRARSIKRVASAVGEGSMAVSLIHEYLASA